MSSIRKDFLSKCSLPFLQAEAPRAEKPAEPEASGPFLGVMANPEVLAVAASEVSLSGSSGELSAFLDSLALSVIPSGMCSVELAGPQLQLSEFFKGGVYIDLCYRADIFPWFRVFLLGNLLVSVFCLSINLSTFS